MNWNIAPECIAAVILSIIWLYSRRGSWLPTLRNRTFQACFLITFLAITTNIISTIMIINYRVFPLPLIWIVTTIYFILTPLMGLVYFLYTATVINTNKKSVIRFMMISSIPALLYIFSILLNPVTKNVFDISAQSGYAKGPWIIVTYIIFYAYCIAAFILALIKRKLIQTKVFNILAAFPILASVVIIIQQFTPEIMLTGSAATSALLIIYLHLENKQISMDYLTAVPNRLELSNMLDFLVSEYPQNHFTIFVLSLRDFRQINSAFTHQVGDMLLRELAQFLSSLVGNEHVFRFKGDEFAVLIKEPREVVNVVLRQIQDRMKRPWKLNEHEIYVSYVIGEVDYPESTNVIENLISAVEYAINTAKMGANGTVCHCDKKMFQLIERKQQIVEILKDKLIHKDFEMYYQPIISVDNYQFEYAESLIRINDSPLGPIYPSEFIPIAEETGLIIEMTYVILDKVCKFVRHLLDNQINIKCIHVNFSAIQFRQSDLARKVSDIITKNNIPFSTIKIEFTESALAENINVINDFADDMGLLGVRMGLDDFGIGYSNISTVVQIPFSTIKLDKSLVWTATEQDKSAITVKNLIRTFKDLKMTVVAEGIETERQNRFVIHNGVDQIQGFYYAKPMSAIDMEAFMKSHNLN